MIIIFLNLIFILIFVEKNNNLGDLLIFLTNFIISKLKLTKSNKI